MRSLSGPTFKMIDVFIKRGILITDKNSNLTVKKLGKCQLDQVIKVSLISNTTNQHNVPSDMTLRKEEGIIPMILLP